MQITIISNGFAGHRSTWMESLLVAIENSPHTILLIVANQSEIGKTWSKSLIGSNYQIVLTKSKRDAIRCAKDVSSTSNRGNIIFWDADKWLPYLLVQSYPCRALVLRYELDSTNWVTYLKSFVKKSLIDFLNRFRSEIDVAYLISPFLIPPIGKINCLSDDLIVHLLRPEMSNLPKSQFGEKGPLFLTPGFVTWRKRPDLIVDYVDTFGYFMFDVECTFMFCGTIDQDVASFLKERSTKGIHLLEGYQTYSSYLELLRSATAILLPYDDFGSSNVLTEAIFFGIPVVVKQSRYWDRLDDKYRHLVFTSSFEPDDLRKTLLKIFLNKNNQSANKSSSLSIFQERSSFGFFCN